jgi:CO dehydrogenase maturation factor
VVVEPGKRSIDCAFTVQRMANEIGVKKLVAVANKVSAPEDEQYIKDRLPDGVELVASIPYSATIRNADREGVSVLDVLDDELKKVFEDMFNKIKGQII